MSWKEDFDKIYPLQVESENNPDGAIIISPVLQKQHKEVVKQFISDLLDQEKAKFVKVLEELSVKEKCSVCTDGGWKECGCQSDGYNDKADEVKSILNKYKS